MKNKVLPFSLLVIIASVLLVSFAYENGEGEGKSEIKAARAENHLATIRNNQHTGQLPLLDVLNAQRQIANQSNYRDAYDMEWKSIGPDNFAGRSRAVLFDNKDNTHETIIASSVTGGIWKSVNAGVTWNKANGESNNLFVSCMTQADDGTIYAGTGEYHFAGEFSQFGQYDYTGGLIGSGIYKSTDSENFELIPATAPTANSDADGWAYINSVAVDNNSGKIFAATNGGLKYSADGGQTWLNPNIAIDSSDFVINTSIAITCDSFAIVDAALEIYNADTTITVDTVSSENIRTLQPMQEDMCMGVDVATDGTIIAYVGGYTFVADASDFAFKNMASYPENIYFLVKEENTISTSIVAEYSNDTNFSEIVSHDYETFKGSSSSLPNPEASSAGIYVGVIECAIAPSDPNVMYASAIKSGTGELINIYVSENKGNDWRIILPGDNTLVDIFDDYGLYANTLAVHPTESGKIYVGCINLWEGEKFSNEGFYQWEQRSTTTYVHKGHLAYAFNPSNPDDFIIATNGGLYFGLSDPSGTFIYEPVKRRFKTTQFYTVSPSGEKDMVIGGAQDNGVIVIDGNGNTPETGAQVYPNLANGNGGYSQISLIDPAVGIYSRCAIGNRFQRSDDYFGSQAISKFLGGDTSQIGTDVFLLPSLLWESFDDENSHDSLYYKASKQILEGSLIQVQSQNRDYPFYTTTDIALMPGDSVLVQDKVQSKFFVGVNNYIYMSFSVLDFSKDVVWYEIANKNKTSFEGIPSCMAISTDGNTMYVGTTKGNFYRFSNIVSAYNEATADCNSDQFVISVSKIDLIDPGTNAPNTQAITSVCINPNDAANVILTLGNYGNDNYVYRSDNAFDSLPSFNSIQGDLPKMPVYASLIEMTDNNLVVIGTEHGIYTSENTSSANPNWTSDITVLGSVPVMMLNQQTVKKLPDYVSKPNGTDTLWTVYPGTNNYGVIYAATYGRGLYRSDKYQKPVGIDEQEGSSAISAASLKAYPNPASFNATFTFELTAPSNTDLRVFNISGQLVETVNVGNLQTGKHSYVYNIEKLSMGTYFIQLITANGSATTKLMVVK
jgi:type IX secretion system substrate protein